MFQISETNPEQYKQLFLELSSSFLTVVRFLLTVLNVSLLKKLLQWRLRKTTFRVLHFVGSLTIALLHAVHLALKLICQSKKQFFLVLSDSLSVLKSIVNCKCDHPHLVDLLYFYFRLICDNNICLGPRGRGHDALVRTY